MKYMMTILAAAALVACGSNSVPQDVVDQNMTIARLNAQKNAEVYFATQYPAGAVDAKPGVPIRVLMQSDSSVSKDCRYGDGWASGTIFYEGGKTLALRCQTNGSGKGINGCMSQAEFVTKTYKDDDGKCQNLPSLEKFK